MLSASSVTLFSGYGTDATGRTLEAVERCGAWFSPRGGCQLGGHSSAAHPETYELGATIAAEATRGKTRLISYGSGIMKAVASMGAGVQI